MSMIELAPPSAPTLVNTRLTAEAFLAAYPETMQRLELIEGVVIELASPTYQHQYVLTQLVVALNPIVVVGQLGALGLSPLDVILDGETVVQPDLFFVSKANQQCHLGENGKWYGPPDLCIEILSSDARHDRVTKMRQYSQHGVREYWIVDPQQRYIEVYLRTEDGHFYLAQDFGQGDHLTSACFPGLQLNVAQVFPIEGQAVS